MAVPCITVRKNTERPITVEVGTNLLLCADRKALVSHARKALSGKWKAGQAPELWDGRASSRIADVLLERF